MIQLQQQLLERSFQMDREQRQGSSSRPAAGQQGEQQQGSSSGDGQQPGQEQMGQSAAEQEALRRALGELMRRMGEAGMEIPRALGQAEMQMRGARGALEQGAARRGRRRAGRRRSTPMQRGGQAMMEQLQEQMAQQQGEGPGGQPQRAGQRGRDPLGRAARNEGGMDTRGVEVPEESDLGRARDVLEELYRRSGDRGRRAARARLLPPPARPVLSRVAGRLRPSPNWDERPAGAAVDMLVLHYTGMATAEAALDRLCDPAAKVSAHYLIDEDGTVVALVPGGAARLACRR